MFENILLEQEQKELFVALVEASRNVPREGRQKFFFMATFVDSGIQHPGLPDGQMNVYKGDIEILGDAGLVRLAYESDSSMSFDVTPLGFKYYEYLKQQNGQSIQRVEHTVTDYLRGDHFVRKFKVAYQKWTEAEAMLWQSESEQQFTTIGHICREAMQEFATALVDYYKPPEVDNDKAHDVARIKAVLNLRGSELGETEKPFLVALLSYWGTVSDLVQRQEHGAQKEGHPLVWGDGRRVVFQVAVVMFEIDNSLARAG